MLSFEQQAWEKGAGRVAGVDEAGRGPLAGPVCAVAIAIERDFLLGEKDGLFQSMTDSKQLASAARHEFCEILTSSRAVEYGVAMVGNAEIDRFNILKATGMAMAQAISQLQPLPDIALVDGNPLPGLPCPANFIVKGDCRSLSIAAASIIAKVLRDRLMTELDGLYPEYGFARHKGYGTRAHLDALRKYGACPCHRRTFAPVREILDPPWDFK